MGTLLNQLNMTPYTAKDVRSYDLGGGTRVNPGNDNAITGQHIINSAYSRAASMLRNTPQQDDINAIAKLAFKELAQTMDKNSLNALMTPEGRKMVWGFKKPAAQVVAEEAVYRGAVPMHANIPSTGYSNEGGVMGTEQGQTYHSVPDSTSQVQYDYYGKPVSESTYRHVKDNFGQDQSGGISTGSRFSDGW